MGAFWQEFGVSPREFLESFEEWELAVGSWYLNDQAQSANADSQHGSPGRELTVEEARAEGLV
jgi:hypothetical protein